MLNGGFAIVTEIEITADDTFVSRTFDGVSSTAITDIILMDLFFGIFLGFFLFRLDFAFLYNFFLDLGNDVWDHFLDFFRNGIVEIDTGFLFLNFLFLWLFFLGFLLYQDLLGFVEEALFTLVDLDSHLVDA